MVGSKLNKPLLQNGLKRKKEVDQNSQTQKQPYESTNRLPVNAQTERVRTYML